MYNVISIFELDNWDGSYAGLEILIWNYALDPSKVEKWVDFHPKSSHSKLAFAC